MIELETVKYVHLWHGSSSEAPGPGFSSQYRTIEICICASINSVNNNKVPLEMHATTAVLGKKEYKTCRSEVSIRLFDLNPKEITCL